MPAPAAPSAVRRDRYYLGSAFVVEHAPAEPLATAVLLLPPFGYEDICAFRPLRLLADRLAEAGHVAIRVDWPTFGDGALDAVVDDVVATGLAAVAEAVASLRARGFTRVAAVGVRAGALVALASPDLDEVALWALPASGRHYLREERAFQKVAARAFGEVPADAPALPAGAVEAGGFVYGAASVAGLERLVSAELAALRRRRVLFLGRDGGAPPAPLAEAFAKAEAEVVVSSADGYGDLGEDPYTAVLKPAVTEAILGWLGRERWTGTAGPPRGASSVRIGDVVERPWVGPGGLSGILCEPASGGTSAWTLLLNAGGVRRCGPNRLWTRAARALAARGRPSLRFDVRDVGDSDGVDTPHDDLEAMYGEGTISDVVAGWDAVTALGATTVDAVGLCSGAYFGIQLAARRKVRRAVLFNGPALVWNDDARASGVTSHILVSLLDGRRWRRLLTGKLDAVFIARSIVDKGRITVRDRLERLAGRPPRDEVAELVAGVQRRGTELLFVSSEGDPSQPYLAAHVPEAVRPPLVVLPAVDHTIRPAWAHSRVLSLIVDGASVPPIR